MERKNAILEHTARQTGQPQQDCDMSKSLIYESINSTKAFKELHWLFLISGCLLCVTSSSRPIRPSTFLTGTPTTLG